MSQMTIRRIACWIFKATNTHSVYVILTAFPMQQWLHERASMLRHTHIACIVTVRYWMLLVSVRSPIASLRTDVFSLLVYYTRRSGTM